MDGKPVHQLPRGGLVDTFLARFAALERRLRMFGPGQQSSWWTILLAVVLLTIGLLFRNLALQSPVMSGDEYAYYASARVLRNVPGLATRDPYLQLVGDPVFLAIGRLFFKLTPNPELLMKVFNALAFASCVLLACILMAALSRNRFPRHAPFVLALLPFSAYSAHFMPESLYALIFLTIAATLVWLLPERPVLGSCVAAFLVAALMLTKPNGAAIFAAVLLTVLALSAAPRNLRMNWSKTLISGGVFVVVAYASEVLLNALIMSKLSWNALLFIGQSYATSLDKALRLASYASMLRGLAVGAAGTFITLLSLAAIPIACLTGWLVSAYSSSASLGPAQTRASRRAYVLVVFAICATLASIAITLLLTAYVGSLVPAELFRLHGRYYAFTFLLLFLGYFALNRNGLRAVTPPGGWRLWALVGLITSLLMIWIQAKYTIYPWDYPELVSTSLWSGPQLLGRSVVGLGIAAYAVLAWKPGFRGVLYPIFLCTVFVVSQYRETAWQVAQANAFGPLSPQGRAMRNLLPEAARSRGVIIGADRYNRMAYFLFGFSSSAHVRQMPPGTQITADQLPSDIEWIMLLDTYDLKIPVQSSLRAGELWIGWLSPASPTVHESVDVWDGKPLIFNFAAGRHPQMLENFGAAHEWGRWASMDGAKIVLPVLISGQVQIQLTGWIEEESLGQRLYLQVGPIAVPLELRTDKGQICEIITVPAPTRTISLRGIAGVDPNPLDEQGAVALAGLKIRKADEAADAACPAFSPIP